METIDMAKMYRGKQGPSSTGASHDLWRVGSRWDPKHSCGSGHRDFGRSNQAATPLLSRVANCPWLRDAAPEPHLRLEPLRAVGHCWRGNGLV